MRLTYFDCKPENVEWAADKIRKMSEEKPFSQAEIIDALACAQRTYEHLKIQHTDADCFVMVEAALDAAVYSGLTPEYLVMVFIEARYDVRPRLPWWKIAVRRWLGVVGIKVW